MAQDAPCSKGRLSHLLLPKTVADASPWLSSTLKNESAGQYRLTFLCAAKKYVGQWEVLVGELAQDVNYGDSILHFVARVTMHTLSQGKSQIVSRQKVNLETSLSFGHLYSLSVGNLNTHTT